MELSEEQLKLLIELAEAMRPIEEIPYILGVDHDMFISQFFNKKSKVASTYYKHFYLTEHKINKLKVEQAKQGSKPAQDAVAVMIDFAKHKNQQYD